MAQGLADSDSDCLVTNDLLLRDVVDLATWWLVLSCLCGVQVKALFQLMHAKYDQFDTVPVKTKQASMNQFIARAY
jgi:hypothetical protein